MGWLLPHGAVEIPAILLGGQAGFLLASALIGWGSRKTRRQRLREVAPDLTTIIFGAGVLLVWAGIVESFLSQYHQPVIPYALKIAFGATELVALTLFLARSGAAAKSEIVKRPNQYAAAPNTGRSCVFAPVGRPREPIPGLGRGCRLHHSPPPALLRELLGASGKYRRLRCDLRHRATSSFPLDMESRCEWYWRGQTVGKRVLKLRVMDEQALRLEFSQIVVRNLLRFVDFLPGLYLVGGTACVLSRRFQRLGDLAANTIVVRNPEVDAAESGTIAGRQVQFAFGVSASGGAPAAANVAPIRRGGARSVAPPR